MAKETKQLNADQQKHLIGVVDGTLNYYITHVFPGIYDIIKMKTGYTKDIESAIKLSENNPEADTTYYIYPIIEPNIDAFHANSFEIDTMRRVVPVKSLWDNIQAAKDASDAMSWIETITNWKDIEDMMRFEATTIWTTYCKYWITYKHWKKLPYAEHVPFFELFVVPWTKDFYNSRYKVYRTIKSENQIADMYGKLFTEKHKKEIRATSGDCFKTRDFNKIWELKLYESSIEEYVASVTEQLSPLEVFTDALSHQFQVIDWENANHEVVEIWEDGVCHVFVNKKYMFSYEDFTNSPFWCVVFEKQPWTYLGRWLGHKLMASQQDANFVYNSLRRAIRQDVFPDTMTIPWALADPITWQVPVSLSYQWGKNYTVNSASLFGGRAFEKIQYATYDTIAILKSRLADIVAESQMIAWTSSYTLGGQWKVERVSWWVAQKNSIFLARLQPMTASIKSMKWYAFYARLEILKKIDKELIYKISENGESSTIWNLNIDDIITKTYVMIDTETNKSIKRYENVELGTKVLSVLSPFASLPEAQKLMVSTLRNVIRDFAYNWDEEKMESEIPQSWVSQSTLDKIKELEWNINTNEERWNNVMMSSLLSQVPPMVNDDEPIWDQQF